MSDDIFIVYQKEANVENFARFKFRTTLDETDFVFDFHWNTRAQRWFMDIFDADENSLKMGLPLHVNSDINGRFAEQNLPQGIFILYDTSGEHEECGFDDFGNRCVLVYKNADSVGASSGSASTE